LRDDDEALVPAPGMPDDGPPRPGPAAAGPGARLRAAIRRRLTAEQLLVLALGLLVLVVHDVGYLLGHGFWTDETWVAATTRFPLSQLPGTTSSTPIGWSALLRVVTLSGTQVSRLPLAFAGAAVAIAPAQAGHPAPCALAE
jgi:hypothetical protein